MSGPKRGSDPAGDFAEIWDSERRNASYLRVVTGGLLVLLLALSTGWCRSASRTLQPVFVRVDEIGRAEALDYDVVRRLNAREVARERWTTNMQFVFRDVDPYELTTNPIGLTITYYAEDRAVSSGG